MPSLFDTQRATFQSKSMWPRVSRMGLALLLGCTMAYSAQAKHRTPIITDPNAADAKGDIPTPKQYLPAIKSYMDFMSQTSSQIIEHLEALSKAAHEGNLEQAQQEYVKAHQAYETIRSVVVVFGFIDPVVNSRADFYIDREQDVDFRGFHKVEYELFAKKDLHAAAESTHHLLHEIKDLKKRVDVETLEIPKLVQSAADLPELILETKLLGQENIYAHSDLADIDANLKGSQKIVDLLAQFIQPKTLETIRGQFKAIDQVLAHYRDAHGDYVSFDQLKEEDKTTLYSLITDLAQQLAQLRSELKIDVYYKYN